MCCTCSILQEEPSKSATVDSKSNNKDIASDLLDVCVCSPFKVSSHNPVGPVTTQHASSLVRLWWGLLSPHSLPLSVLILPELPSLGLSTWTTHLPEGKVLPSTHPMIYHNYWTLSQSPPQDAVPEEYLNSNKISKVATENKAQQGHHYG